jgi:glutamine amidotransferase-like uncharacterized protein
VNRLLASGAASVLQAGDRYLLKGSSATIKWNADRLGVPLTAAQASTPGAPIRLRRIAVYNGQGVSNADWGEIVWALEQAEFPYQLAGEDAIVSTGILNELDVLIVPQGSADAIVNGWDPEAPGRRSPWQPSEPARGLGREGLDAIRKYIENGGTYVGLGGGGARLAADGYLALTDTELVPSNVGLGQVRLQAVKPDSPLLFGYKTDELIPAFFYGPPGSAERGYAFRSEASSVAAYAGVREAIEELSFTSTEVLSAETGNAAILEETIGRGRIVLFGIAPVFRGQWKSTFRLLYNALYLSIPR